MSLTLKDDLIINFINILKRLESSIFILPELYKRINECIKNNSNNVIIENLNNILKMLEHHKYNSGAEYSYKLILKNILNEDKGIDVVKYLIN